MAEKLTLPWTMMILDIPTDLIEKDEKRYKMWEKHFEILKDANSVIFNTWIARQQYYKWAGRETPAENVIPYAFNVVEEYDKSGIDMKGDYVLSICRLTPLKNCNAIPRALALLDTKLTYISIGRDGGDLKNIRQLCNENLIPFVHYEKVTDKEKFNLIKGCSMLIYPQNTKYIGGLSPLEAMYCGKPVIAKYYPVLTQLYDKHASYFNTNYELASQISTLHNFKRELLKPGLIEANEHAKKTATFPVMAKRLLEVFEKVRNK